MTSVGSVYGTGYSTAAPSEAQTLLRRRDWVGDGTVTPIVFCHSWGATAATGAFPTTGISTTVPTLLRHLVRCGWPVVAPDLAGDNWGNTTGIARVAEAKTYAQGAAVGGKTGPIVLAAWSHGGLAAMAYARANPSSVKAMILLQPASDLNDVAVNNRQGAAASLNAAYGGAYSNSTDGPTHSPAQFAAQLAGIPTLIYYSTDDTSVIPSTVQTVIAGIGSSCESHTLTGGHGDGSLSKIDPLAVSSWLNGVDTTLLTVNYYPQAAPGPAMWQPATFAP